MNWGLLLCATRKIVAGVLQIGMVLLPMFAFELYGRKRYCDGGLAPVPEWCATSWSMYMAMQLKY
jgi:hypothetical protein